jgi:hypothetical protein
MQTDEEVLSKGYERACTGIPLEEIKFLEVPFAFN